MAIEKITILTVNFNTADYINVMLFAFSKLTDSKYKVVICDNGSSSTDIAKLVKIVRAYNNVSVIFRKQSAHGSIGHAEALDLLVDYVDTPYFMVMDSDCTILLNQWDVILISKLNKTVKAIGTPVISYSTSKSKDFPLMFATLYESEVFKSLKCSFMPDRERISDGKDTGWEIREKYLENGFKGIIFDAFSTRNYRDQNYSKVICGVYYWNGDIVASHFGRGSSGGKAKYRGSWYLKIPVIATFSRYLLGKIEKERWIKASIKIINKSSKVIV